MSTFRRVHIFGAISAVIVLAGSDSLFAQAPGRNPTRRVEGQAPQQATQQPGQPQFQIQIGGVNLRPQRQIQARNERAAPTLNPNTGQFEIRREVLVRPPHLDPVRITRQWRLGIHVENAPRGLRITEISRNSSAFRYGIEQGDYLLDIMGYPVGFYEGNFYPLAETLNQVVQRDGWVNVLIWNKRTNAAEAMWVQAERRRNFEERESSN